MKLKEFALWGFKLPLEESRKFTLFNRSVCAHFERHFEAIDTDGVYRVIVKLSESDERVNTTEESSSVLKYYKTFDFASFNKLEEQSKKNRSYMFYISRSWSYANNVNGLKKRLTKLMIR